MARDETRHTRQSDSQVLGRCYNKQNAQQRKIIKFEHRFFPPDCACNMSRKLANDEGAQQKYAAEEKASSEKNNRRRL